MSKYKIIKYQKKYFNEWNNFVDNSNNGTIFHRLDFLNYHGDKFKENEHHLIILKGETIFGVIPLAIFNENGRKIAKSPYGASYGGFVFADVVKYSTSKKIIESFILYLIKNNINELFITPSIGKYCKVSCNTFNFVLLESGFKIINSDISSTVKLIDENILSNVFTSRARNMVTKAKKYGIRIKKNTDNKIFWDLLSKTYSKFEKKPTHNIHELNLLRNKFPGKIYSYIALYENKAISGILIFELNNKTQLAFYLVSDNEFLFTQSLSCLIYYSIQKAKEKGFEVFDFGTSSSNMIANPNLFQFKESFGAVGVIKDTYKLVIKI